MNIRLLESTTLRELVFPVIPEVVKIDSPMGIEEFESIGQGTLKLIGLKGSRIISLSSFFPNELYPFHKDKNSNKKSWEYVQDIEFMKLERKPLYLIIDDLNIAINVAISNFSYQIKDGTKDIYYDLTLEEYIYPGVIETSNIQSPTTVIKTVSEEKVTVNADSYGAVTASALNVRSGPGLGYEILKLLPNGEKVKLLRQEDEWWQIPDGYVNAKYIKR